MTVNAERVGQVIRSGGLVWYNAANEKLVSKQIIQAPQRDGMMDNFTHAKVEFGDNEVLLKSVPGPEGADAVNIKYRDRQATFADLEAPGYIYSDSFSGCVFYLFRGPLGYLHAVHAYRGGGRLADPTEYFKARGGKLLYKWDSLGMLTQDELMSYQTGAVLACVSRDTIDVFAFATKNREVKRLIDHTAIPGWVASAGLPV
ncbi:hypothetical protein EUZ85_18355 [Hahella sp. KA22]|uniref:hypothetical protein n=1 Tax=Hahella sp. KA22 TaxID=1628392 RepID=UPI000FDCDE5B|nr:hypothetical protein [Hahella sp. KA22]AZZ92578.1 hypothetical protein ENC22_15780 [Hahella sp. KA22]QAY55951.1 hypothetical protein EUZ85_18355 [Hahella sp. KA22]